MTKGIGSLLHVSTFDPQKLSGDSQKRTPNTNNKPSIIDKLFRSNCDLTELQEEYNKHSEDIKAILE